MQQLSTLTFEVTTMSNQQENNIKPGWYAFRVRYQTEQRMLDLIKMYLTTDNYPNKAYLLTNRIVSDKFSFRYYIEGLGLPRNFDFNKQKVSLPYSEYIFLKIKECSVSEFNDFLRVIKQIPEVIDVIGQKFDVRPNKRMKPYIYKTYPIVLRDKQEQVLKDNVDQFDYEVSLNSIRLNAPYKLTRGKVHLTVTTLSIKTDTSVEVRDKKENKFTVRVSELSKIKGFNYLD